MYSEYTSPEAKLFKAGLKHHPKKVINTVTNTTSTVEDQHDRIDY